SRELPVEPAPYVEHPSAESMRTRTSIRSEDAHMRSPTPVARRLATAVVALALVAGVGALVATVWTPSDPNAEQSDPLLTEVVDVTDTSAAPPAVGPAPPAVGAADETWSYFLHLGTFRDSGDAKAFLARVELAGFGPAISESASSQGV